MLTTHNLSDRGQNVALTGEESTLPAATRWLTSAYAMSDFMATRDRTLMRRVHHWPAPRWIRIWMICATRAGDGRMWCAIGLTAFAVTVSLSFCYPKLSAALLWCSLSICASRILLGMHLLSDVLAGAAMGTALAQRAVKLLKVVA